MTTPLTITASSPEIQQPNLLPPSPQPRVYQRRYGILVLYSLATFTNTILWTSFAPISSSAALYFFPNDVTTDTGSSSSEQLIDLIALTYLILYAPGTIASSIWTKRGGLRHAVLLASFFTSIGSLLRFMSCTFLSNPTWKYVGVIMGQSLAAFAQPTFTNGPGLLAGNWFGVKQRDLAVTVASLFGVLGNAMGSVLPTFLVRTVSSEEGDGVVMEVHGMETLMLVHFIMASIMCVACWWKLESYPPTPPTYTSIARLQLQLMIQEQQGNPRSAPLSPIKEGLDESNMEPEESASFGLGLDVPLMESQYENEEHHNTTTNHKDQQPLDLNEQLMNLDCEVIDNLEFSKKESEQNIMNDDEHSEITMDTFSGFYEQQQGVLGENDVKVLWRQVNQVLHDRSFFILLVAFSFGYPIFSSLLTLINNYLSPCGYTQDEAGLYSAYLLLSGILGAAIAGLLMDKTHAYRPLLKLSFFGTVSSLVLLCKTSVPDNGAVLSGTFALVGFWTIPILPIVMENAIECTYPLISEELSVGILFTAGNIVSIPYCFFMQYLIDLPSSSKNEEDMTCLGMWSPVNIWLMLTGGISLGGILFYNGRYNRLDGELNGEVGMDM